MKPELEKALTGVLEVIKEAATQVGAVAKEQLPLVVREYLSWGVAEAVTWIALGLVVWCVGMYVGVVIHRSSSNACVSEYCRDPECSHMRRRTLFGLIFLPCISTMLLVMISFSSVLTLIQIQVAPRVYLLEQVKEMLK